MPYGLRARCALKISSARPRATDVKCAWLQPAFESRPSAEMRAFRKISCFLKIARPYPKDPTSQRALCQVLIHSKASEVTTTRSI